MSLFYKTRIKEIFQILFLLCTTHADAAKIQESKFQCVKNWSPATTPKRTWINNSNNNNNNNSNNNHHHHHHCSSRQVVHRAETRSLHLLRSFASFAASRQFRFSIFNSDSTVLLQVDLGRPRFRLPSMKGEAVDAITSQISEGLCGSKLLLSNCNWHWRSGAHCHHLHQPAEQLI